MARGEGKVPSTSGWRSTRPPSKSMLTANGRPIRLRSSAMSRPGVVKMAASVSEPMKMPPAPCSSAARASSKLRTPTIMSCATLVRNSGLAGVVEVVVGATLLVDVGAVVVVISLVGAAWSVALSAQPTRVVVTVTATRRARTGNFFMPSTVLETFSPAESSTRIPRVLVPPPLGHHPRFNKFGGSFPSCGNRTYPKHI